MRADVGGRALCYGEQGASGGLLLLAVAVGLRALWHPGRLLALRTGQREKKAPIQDPHQFMENIPSNSESPEVLDSHASHSDENRLFLESVREKSSDFSSPDIAGGGNGPMKYLQPTSYLFIYTLPPITYCQASTSWLHSKYRASRDNSLNQGCCCRSLFLTCPSLRPITDFVKQVA
jgi:hypothetical protein